MNKNYTNNVLIIGSGIGGLSCGIILLKLGYKVTIIEKNREPGGMMRSYKRNGINCPVGVHYLGSLDKDQPLRRIFDYLGVTSRLSLERMGIDSPIDKYIFDDFSFELPSGIEAYENALREKFPSDNAQITEIMTGLKKVASMMQSLDFLFGRNDNHSIFSSFELFDSIGGFLSKLNCSKNLRSVLEVPCTWIGLPLIKCPVFYHYNVLSTYLFSSWRLKTSGSDMADIFADRFKELGGEIFLDEEADKILTNDRIICGIKLKSGLELKVNTIIAAIHPKTMLNILQEGAAKPAYIKRINQIENTDGMFSAQYALDSNAHKELPYNIFKLKVAKDGSLSKGVFFQLRTTEKPDINLLTIISTDKISNWKKWENTYSGRRGNDYIDKKEKEAEELAKPASNYLGILKIIKLLDVYTPLTIRDWVASPDGSAYGVLRSADQLLKTASLNRTSVKGLYLAGQSVLAPGILGTALGSLMTVKDIVGSEIFYNELKSINKF
ncbi:MAG: NAD(P)/FAD-dependent oxidoreductase [Spirochaetes bacterium]|nr:NAD(P)/FAD-dependent oxidoreductase [Spirochaetota bacterium]